MKGVKLSGWACLVIRCTGRRRPFVSTEIRPRVFLNSITVQAVSSLLRFIQHVGNTRCILACIASVSVRFSARLSVFRFWRRKSWGERNTDLLPLLVRFCARPNFRAFKKRKMLQTCGKPYGNACYAG